MDVDPAVNAPDHEARSKTCAVCGDKALGYNFNAITCESCKAFFRRNALKTKAFNCPFSSNCEVTVITRRFCQKCRLNKCFSIGMKKESILSEEERKQKWEKIRENRAKRQYRPDESQHDSSSNSPNPTCDSSRKQPRTRSRPSSGRTSVALKPDEESMSSDYEQPVTSTENGILNETQTLSDPYQPQDVSVGPQFASDDFFTDSFPQVIDFSSSMLSSEAGHNMLTGHTSHRVTKYPQNMLMKYPQTFENVDVKNELGEHKPKVSICQNNAFYAQNTSKGCYTTIENLDAVIAIAIKAEFHTSSLDMGEGGKDLNDRERARLEELYVASRSLVEPVELEKEEYSPEPNNLISVINMTDIAIKRIIRMAKKITPFISMCQEDQIALLKGGCTELMILRSVINYDPDKNSWRLPSTGRPKELRMDVLKEASQLGVNLYEKHQQFVKSFDPRWRSDENVMLLLSAISLFSPDRSNVLHKDVIKLEQDTYYFLLRRYLETVCNPCESRSVYLNLISKLVDLHRLNESHIQLFLEVNPKLVEPLLIEIFDLNPDYR